MINLKWTWEINTFKRWAATCPMMKNEKSIRKWLLYSLSKSMRWRRKLGCWRIRKKM